MASEIRVDKINSLSGVGTVTLSPTGVDIAGITTAATLRATTGIVTSLTAGSLTSLGAVSGTTGTFTGNVAVSGANITLQDSGGATDDRIVLGAGSDLSIYHDGNHSYIDNTGTGNLYLKDAGAIRINTDSFAVQKNDGSESIISGTADGAVDLYHNNTTRLSTTGNGVDVFGNGTTNNYLKLVNTSGTSNASHHMTLDTYGLGSGGSYWSDLKIDASNIQLNTYTGNRATLSNTALTFASGVNIVMASGNGIDFSATADGSGSSQAEILDDYEEGSWTFAITPGGGSYQYNYGQTGYYRKIGNTVFINAWVHLVVSSTVSGGITLSGLPFPCQNRSRNWIPVGGYGHGGPPIASSGLWMILTTNATTASFIYNDDQFGAAVGLTAGNLPTSAEMYINGSYLTDS